MEPGFPALLLAMGGVVFEEMRQLAGQLAELGVEVVAISDQREILLSAAEGIPLGCTVPDWLSPLVTVVPGQWLALHLALVRGLDPDRPRRLAKVTKTR